MGGRQVPQVAKQRSPLAPVAITESWRPLNAEPLPSLKALDLNRLALGDAAVEVLARYPSLRQIELDVQCRLG